MQKEIKLDPNIADLQNSLWGFLADGLIYEDGCTGRTWPINDCKEPEAGVCCISTKGLKGKKLSFRITIEELSNEDFDLLPTVRPEGSLDKGDS